MSRKTPLISLSLKKTLAHAFFAFFALVFGAQTVSAMDFSRTSWQGLPALLAEGPIRPGDRVRLADALAETPNAIHGHKILLLDSPGGLVFEALAMAELFDALEVHTVVPYGAECFSACGSILFLGGDIKTLELGGLLGQHTCYEAEEETADQACNDLVGQHAFEHGHSHGSTYAFMSAVPPHEMISFSQQDSECWGLSRYYDPAGAFDKSEPCLLKLLRGRKPNPSSGWRVSFLLGGAYAFARGVADDELRFELRLYCQEDNPGALYLSLLIPMPKEEIDTRIEGASLIFGDIASQPQPAFTNSIAPALTEIGIVLPPELTLPLLQPESTFGISIELRDYDPMAVWRTTGESQENLIFAANHCRPKGGDPTLPVFP